MVFQLKRYGDHLDLMMTQRSCDIFLGVPYNIAGYAFLQHLLAKITGTTARTLIINFGDFHIYENHFDQVREQLKCYTKPLPKLIIPDVQTLADVEAMHIGDIAIEGYEPHPSISAPVAV